MADRRLEVVLMKLAEMCAANAHAAERVLMLSSAGQSEAQKSATLEILESIETTKSGVKLTIALIEDLYREEAPCRPA